MVCAPIRMTRSPCGSMGRTFDSDIAVSILFADESPADGEVDLLTPAMGKLQYRVGNDLFWEIKPPKDNKPRVFSSSRFYDCVQGFRHSCRVGSSRVTLNAQLRTLSQQPQGEGKIIVQQLFGVVLRSERESLCLLAAQSPIIRRRLTFT